MLAASDSLLRFRVRGYRFVCDVRRLPVNRRSRTEKQKRTKEAEDARGKIESKLSNLKNAIVHAPLGQATKTYRKKLIGKTKKISYDYLASE